MKQRILTPDPEERIIIKQLQKKYAKLRKVRHKAKRAINADKVKPLPVFDGWKSWKAFSREK
jgi:hypothetical protein